MNEQKARALADLDTAKTRFGIIRRTLKTDEAPPRETLSDFYRQMRNVERSWYADSPNVTNLPTDFEYLTQRGVLPGNRLVPTDKTYRLDDLHYDPRFVLWRTPTEGIEKSLDSAGKYTDAAQRQGTNVWGATNPAYSLEYGHDPIAKGFLFEFGNKDPNGRIIDTLAPRVQGVNKNVKPNRADKQIGGLPVSNHLAAPDTAAIQDNQNTLTSIYGNRLTGRVSPPPITDEYRAAFDRKYIRINNAYVPMTHYMSPAHRPYETVTTGLTGHTPKAIFRTTGKTDNTRPLNPRMPQVTHTDGTPINMTQTVRRYNFEPVNKQQISNKYNQIRRTHGVAPVSPTDIKIPDEPTVINHPDDIY
jgi:hypothetical protein